MILAILLTSAGLGFAQKMDKKTRSFQVSRELPFSAEQVWGFVADDYGSVGNAHPKIIKSNYIAGSVKGEEGAQRACFFNEKQTQFLKEEIVDWNPAQGYFVNRVIEAKKFPIDVENTQARYTITSLGPNRSKITIKMNFRTKPAMMGGVAKSQFKNLISDYFIAIEHHLKTGEQVTASNFKEVKKGYRN